MKQTGNLRQAINSMAREGGGTNVTVRLPLETGFLYHDMADSIEFRARMLGLRTAHVKVGSWLNRSHIIEVEGPVRDVQAWAIVVDRALQAAGA